ncbi:MAG: cellulose biosynthesis cyclic di-GMP-binding regulatory protein BcsB [Devosia sp.]|uniref:cellulose biosynthesis cyclic di-GMP-binding regulatory protein BcsB n=1 Tax=Devosia sp. TaxID=1871048 RepID=UPI0024C9713B|nr:cellulose biosynthesis cyclic di-GMP-binding regulatory protein BcsB [Devosia sp.]UYO00559.1 MAG: cellulose biosynthesis cyclic di-GMP-binding regulatory protein BcsB [Devosia sp.]
MRKSLYLLPLLACANPALAETVTITTSLEDHGYPDGMILSGRQSASLYLPLPPGVDVSNVRVSLDALAVTPNLARGSVVVLVNGVPVEAERLEESSSARKVALEALVSEGDPMRAQALDVRFRADLIAHSEICTDDFDPADTLQVLADTTVSYDVDLDALTTIGDALALLPGKPLIEVPSPLTPEASAAALQLAGALAAKGYRAEFGAEGDGEGPVHLRLVQGDDAAGVRLERGDGALVVAISENADIAALSRLWQAAPAALAGDDLTTATMPDSARGSDSGFVPFASLPGPLRVLQTGDIGLDFAMLDADGRRATEARLRLMVAPDWSDAEPVVTVYLNGQMLTALRADIGENLISAPLPDDLLRQSNRLTVVVDRAQREAYCPGPSPGHAVQLMTGTGVDYDSDTLGGFAAVAKAFKRGGTLILPPGAADADGTAYLGLAARVLSGLGVGSAPVSVAFSDADPAAGTPVIRIAPSGINGLSLPVAPGEGQEDVNFSISQPLASLVADGARERLDVVVLQGQTIPDPTSVFLGNGSKALVGDQGVLWQDVRTGAPSALLDQARDASRGIVDILRAEGVFWTMVIAGLLLLVVAARELMRRHFRRRARK